MAPHIVAWGPDNDKRPISPVPSTVGSIVSIESIASDSSIIPRSTSEGTSRRSMGFTERKVPPGLHLAVDSPFVRHEKYFFQDGNITFLIDGILYCVHRYFFSRDSEYFSSRLTQLGIREHEALSIIISLGDVESKDFEALLSVIYPDDFEGHDLSYEQWKSILHLSTRWGFASLRRLALGSIEPPTPFDQLLLARAYSVDDWVLPALSELCERTVPLSLNEARQMSIEDVVLLTTVREDIRHHALQVDMAEIPHCIEAAQAGMAAIAAAASTRAFHPPRSDAASSPSTGGSRLSTGSMRAKDDEEDDAKTAVALSPVDVRRTRRKESALPSPVSPLTARPAERTRPAPKSAWDRIPIIPSPTLSVRSNLPSWGTGSSNTNCQESNYPSAWQRLNSLGLPDPASFQSGDGRLEAGSRTRSGSDYLA